MDPRRADTLEALSAYIQHQRSLLARTQADIDRLKQLRALSVTDTQDRLGELLGLDAYHPSAAFPDKIDWQAFSSCDPTPLRTLAIRSRLHHTQCSVPQPIQRSPLSALQKFVKDARKIIIDPVLESIYRTTHPDPTSIANDTNIPESPLDTSTPFPTLPTSLSEDESGPHTPPVQESTTSIRKRERARAKIRELKKRKIRSDLVVGCKLGEEGSDSVFVRHDVDDETVEVDVSMGITHSTLPTPVDRTSVQGDEDAASSRATPIQHSDLRHRRSADLSQVYPSDISARSSRIRKPSLKLQPQGPAELNDPSSALPSPSSLGKRSRESSEVKSATRKPKIEPLSSSTDANTEANRSRSDTYKQAWSISEQHLLERLLEEIPDGERNRWAKISQAMGGRRTPRQVASRVQKYFEKLKRFGLDVDKSKGS